MPARAGNPYFIVAMNLHHDPREGRGVDLTAKADPVSGELLAGPSEAAQLRKKARELPSWSLSEHQLCHVELLLNGAFHPLCGFLGRRDYESVLENMRLADGVLWPIPVCLDVSREFAAALAPGCEIVLCDQEGVPVAILTVSDIYEPDKSKEAACVYRTLDAEHPGVDALLNHTLPVYIGGRLRGLCLPAHHDFRHLRDTPAELRGRFHKLGWRRVVAFHTRSVMHRAHYELTVRAVQAVEANLLIHAVVGFTRPVDAEHYARVRCYEQILRHYPEHTAILSLLPLALLHAGPREALLHAIVHRNYGCTHLIIGSDHGSPPATGGRQPYYGPYEAQELVAKHQAEVGIEVVAFQELVYVPERACYLPRGEVPQGAGIATISKEELRRRLDEDLEIPGWFSFPEVIAELRRYRPPRHRQGFTVFFTGLSGAGKSTIANALAVRLMEIGDRPVTLLDGDIVRRNLSSELGFSRRDRDLNIQRIAFVANEITKNGGIALCAPIAPYRAARRRARELISRSGGFVEVYVSTPLAVCEGRDRKGLYARARAGLIPAFTGVSDPYEVPENPDIEIDTTDTTPDEAAQRILLRLQHMGFIR